ncbi:putative membrane protein [Rhodopirellula maiorica SM1]|uniref:Putative membrane protein n=1 Tax=Rhodopirellula maiorica SM1 TaxID=1265738 RepID=M5RN97_9BACT|nr:DUF5690 family protein [Rhodopirellula maiorica]EMI20681.1 putative membrane protein [Rhodopirellula maiorica SM1]
MKQTTSVSEAFSEPESKVHPWADSSPRVRLIVAACAAFSVYFCMYAFRKPFTAGTFEDQTVFGLGLKTTLVVSQLLGYMLSKFIGIKVVSEMRSEYRTITIIGLITFAELSLVGFAFLPMWTKPFFLFLNGLPLGMVFGLVLGYLEGRKQTEALSAALCASFIIASGVVKSVGRWLIQDWGISEFQMPMMVGLIFFPPLLVAVWALQKTPPPNDEDCRLRRQRKSMNRADRRGFLVKYWPGLACLVFVYVVLTIVRTIRDDFAVEIWRDMGVNETPSVFATSEIAVALFVTALNALAICFRNNLVAIRMTLAGMGIAFAFVVASVLGQGGGFFSPFVFMVACGVGLYVPYVAFHTTVFERLIAASKLPSNLGFLMYFADAMGYLGYAVVMILQTTLQESMQRSGAALSFFTATLTIVAAASMVALAIAYQYFRRVLTDATSV